LRLTEAEAKALRLTLPELLQVAERVLSGEPPVRDIGLLEAAVARPRATAFGAAMGSTVVG
jgi:hypothetical protein